MLESDNLVFNIGDTAEFRCIVSGDPTPQVEWFRAGGLPEDAVIENGNLRFRVVGKEQEGAYDCVASSPAGRAHVRAILVVPEDLPEFEVVVAQPTISVRPGEDARFECSAKSRVEVEEIQWSKYGDELPQGAYQEGGRLVIPECKPSDSGQYICTIYLVNGERKVSYASLVVEGHGIGISQPEQPVVILTPDRQVVMQGTTATITCDVTGNPPPAVKWTKSREELGPNHQVHGNVLRILEASPEDRGVYICEAENAAGFAYASSILEIERHDPPEVEVYPESSVTLPVGGSALFQCRTIRGTPEPTVSWTRANREQLTDNTELLENGVIRFNGVTGPEQGTYVCTAVNSAGTVTASVTLLVQGLPRISVKSSTERRITSGEPLTLECAADGFPVPHVRWQPPRGADIPVAEGIGTAVLSIRSISRDDAGIYICYASNDAGRVESTVEVTVEEVVFEETIETTVWPSEHSIAIGQQADFQCTASTTGLQPPVFQWSKLNGPMPINHIVRDGLLRIQRVTEDDAGTYQCIARGVHASAQASVRLFILVPPVITISPQTQTLRPGDLFRIQCNAIDTTTNEVLDVKWSRVEQNRHLSPSASELDGLLEIVSVTASDAGRYRCTAQNNAGRSESIAELVIFAPPSAIISPRTVSMSAGRTVEFRCDVTGSPHPVIQWIKEGGALPVGRHSVQGGVLTLYDIARGDEGQYICVVTNQVGTTRDFASLQITGSASSSGQVPIRYETVTVGDAVELNCSVTGEPRPVIRWSKVDGVLPPSAVVDGPRVFIPHITESDQGTYRCTATNAAGSSMMQTVITVEAPPAIPVSRQSRTISVGSRVTLACRAQGNPPPYIAWKKRGGELPRDHMVDGGILTIPNMRDEDFGEYDCIARNKLGFAEAIIELLPGELIPYFEQNPESYLSYPTIDEAYRQFDIELSFKPQTTDGLILYNGQMADGTGDFVSFGMRNRRAEFRLDVGSGPAVITSDPLPLDTWHTVRVKRDGRDAAMYIGELEFKGQAPGTFIGLDLTENLYVGAVPDFQKISRAAGFSRGYVGCISRLVISGRPINLGGEMLATTGITDCPVCQGRPCRNGGTCLPATTDTGYRCICPRGYSGDMCELVGERCSPRACSNGGRCYDRPDGAGYFCTCPIGLSGEHCEYGALINVPNFNTSSYIAYPTIRDPLLSVQLNLTFKATSLSDGLLLYNAYETSGSGDFIALSIQDGGHLVFQFDTGSGPAILRSHRPIAVNEWTTVVAERSRQDGSLIVNGDVAVKGQAPSNGAITPGPTVGLNLRTYLYLGGVDWTEIRVSPFVGVDIGFRGCISELMVSGLPLDLIHSAVANRNIQECEDDRLRACSAQTCLNGGTCRVLGTDSFQCHCPLGFTGVTCNMRAVLNTDAQFAGDGSYIELPTQLLPHRRDSVEESIRLTVTTTQNNALLFWHGQTPTISGRGKDYIAIAIDNGYPVFSFELGSGPANITGGRRINDGQPHQLITSRIGQLGSLEVDSEGFLEGASLGLLTGVNTSGNIYLGGLPDARLMTAGKFTHALVGCISDVYIQSAGPLNLTQHAVRGVNIRPCSL
jgi:dystroglycan 1